MLNGRPYYLRLVLDQGYWPDSFMTAPDSEAFIREIELVKRMGFNGVRKHQKIEDPRFLYWADRLGLLVWEEMPSAYRFLHNSVERLVREWIDVIERDYNHPCVIVWVPFNESWGVPDLAEKMAHQNCVRALYYLTKSLDPSRVVIGNDGWESISTDIIGIHDYDQNPARLLEKYGSHRKIPDLLNKKRPGGRILTIGSYSFEGHPFVLTEFGGIAFSDRHQNDREWGYGICHSPEEYKRRFRELLLAVHRSETLSGFCYTQLTDTFQEANGLVYADRTPKIAVEEIRRAVLGPEGQHGLPGMDGFDADG